jgi:hypothetical protein
MGDLFPIKDGKFGFEAQPLRIQLFVQEAAVFHISITSKEFQYLFVNLRIHRR